MAVCLKADEGEHHAETRTRRKDKQVSQVESFNIL